MGRTIPQVLLRRTTRRLAYLVVIRRIRTQLVAKRNYQEIPI
jgi:hypothetical protein